MKNIKNIINNNSTIIYVFFTIVLTVVYSLLYNTQLFKNQYPEEYFKLLILISIARDAVIWYIAGLNRYIFLIFTPIMFMSASALNYFVTNLNMGIGIGIFELFFNTNVKEAAGVINPNLVSEIVISLVISAIFITIRFFIKSVPTWKVRGILLILFLIPVFLGKMPEDDLKEVKYGKGGTTERGIHLMPEKILENLYQYSLSRYRLYKMYSDRENAIKTNVTFDDNDKNPEIVVFILTDALRRDHMSINGYERKTTPHLENIGFISYNDMYACETSTTRSVPCLTTSTSRKDERFSFIKKPSILSLYRQAGFDTAWISSQGAITTADFGANVVASDADFSFFSSDVNKLDTIFYDTDLLPIFDEFLSRNNKRKAVILHLNGSHWQYNTRYTESQKKWSPDCSQWVYDCSLEEVINAYDNTIIATDVFFAEVVKRLQDKNAIIFFTSDHGQFLGEKGFRLHQHEMLNHKELAVVPFGVWLSDIAKNNPYLQNIALNKDKYTSHDNIFHSITNCGGLKSDTIDEKLSICNPHFVGEQNEFP